MAKAYAWDCDQFTPGPAADALLQLASLIATPDEPTDCQIEEYRQWLVRRHCEEHAHHDLTPEESYAVELDRR